MRRVFLAALLPVVALAHPMGNFSINHYSALHVRPGFLEIEYLIDMAEIPTFQVIQESGLSGQTSDARLQPYLRREGAALSRRLRVTVGGAPAALRQLRESAVFTPGAGGLLTIRLHFTYGTALHAGVNDIVYADSNFAGRSGWKEIIADTARNVELRSSTVPNKDRSAKLSNYAADVLSDPPQVTEAHLIVNTTVPIPRVVAAEPATVAEPVTPAANAPIRPTTPRNAFTELVHSKRSTPGFLVLCALIAAGLGAMHALEPGHGKTVVAAYLVGSRGTVRHALWLGLIVTASHTFGVYVLGFIAMYAQHSVMPERLYPLLNVVSGVLIAGMGAYLLLQRLTGVTLEHTHGSEATHTHFGIFRHTHSTAKTVTLRQLIVLGVTGGIVPCPAAVVVLLSAFSLHRLRFGMFLIVAFSVGLAAVLIATGMIVIYASRLARQTSIESPLVQRWLPMTSAAVMMLLGIAIGASALLKSGLNWRLS